MKHQFTVKISIWGKSTYLKHWPLHFLVQIVVLYGCTSSPIIWVQSKTKGIKYSIILWLDSTAACNDDENGCCCESENWLSYILVEKKWYMLEDGVEKDVHNFTNFLNLSILLIQEINGFVMLDKFVQSCKRVILPFILSFLIFLSYLAHGFIVFSLNCVPCSLNLVICFCWDQASQKGINFKFRLLVLLITHPEHARKKTNHLFLVG